jgi:hypothetical protein
MVLEEVGWGIDWIDLFHGKERWWILVNGVMKLPIV